uniref:Odorant binding protein 38 n=1 Tax=Heliconius charithonia TaxID=33434 RepID=A0AA49EZX9_HELCH|nr:odorant binding protein 38 [Heliconius charithonia]
MKIIFTITLALLTFSVAQCGRSVGNRMSTDDITTTTIATTMENEDPGSNFDIMAVMVDCNDTFRVEMSYLESLNQSGSFPDETDKTPKCFVRCVLEKSSIVSGDSQFNVTRAAEVFSQIRDISQNDIIKMATACSDRPETCKCERSYQYLKCLLETTIEIYDTRNSK